MMKSTSFASWSSLVVSCLLIVTSGCSNLDGDSSSPTSPNKSDSAHGAQGDGIAVSSAALQSSKTEKIKFVVYECQTNGPVPAGSGSSYGPKVAEKIKDLEAMTLPGGIETFENKPFDKDSEHHFADAFFTLPEGCYDVKTIPLDGYGNRNEQCEKAHETNLEVTDGETLETLLINQCEGKKRGGLDVISALNYAPVLKKIKFHPSKFLKCKERGAICFKAKDRDDDPLRSEVKFNGSEPEHATEPFPKHFLSKCKSYCNDGGGNGGMPKTLNVPNGENGKDGHGEQACLPRCVEYLRYQQKHECTYRCEQKCPGEANADSSPETEGTDGNGNGNGYECVEQCKTRCLRPTGKLKQCILVDPKHTGSYNITVKVFDQLWDHIQEDVFSTANSSNGNGDGSNGEYGNKELIDFETFYDQQENYPDDLESRDSLTFPLHVGGTCEKQYCKCKPYIEVKGYIVKRKVPDEATSSSQGDYQKMWVDSLSQVHEGDLVKAVFKVPDKEKCRHTKLTFASYKANGNLTQSSSESRRLYDWKTKKVGPGYHGLGYIKIPDCSFRVGLACGKTLSGRDLERGTLYGHRKIAWGAGGSGDCQMGYGCTKPPSWWKTCRYKDTLKNKHLCNESYYSILHGAMGGLYGKLAKYYIAAKMSAHYGASQPKGVQRRMYKCGDVLRQSCSRLQGGDRKIARYCKKVMKKYVYGKIGPGMCPENGLPNGTNG
jgi:hypothetical protein